MDDDSAPYPLALWVAQWCEAFPGRFPSELFAEFCRLPAGYLEEVQEARGYVTAKQYYDSVKEKTDLPQHWPMLDRVREIHFDLVREARERAHAGRDHD